MTKISPQVDVVFKKIFGVEENKDLLISLINSIVSKDDQVSDIILLNPYNPKHFLKDKLSILDIKAKGIDGKRFNIEIQITDEADYDKRALYYWAKLYTEQLKEAEDYSSLSKAIGIHILNFTSIFESVDYHNVFHIREKKSGLLYFNDLELHTIELKKFTKDIKHDINDLVEKIKTSLDIWLAFLTRYNLLNIDYLPPALQSEALKKAIHVLNVMYFSDEEKQIYEEHLKWLQIEANTLKKYQEKGFEAGLEKGREEGEQVGLEKGREEGRVKEKSEMITKMRAKGKSLEEIADLLDVSVEEILYLTE